MPDSAGTLNFAPFLLFFAEKTLLLVCYHVCNLYVLRFSLCVDEQVISMFN